MRNKIEGRTLLVGEMAYLLAHAGLDWSTIKWVCGYAQVRNAHSMARKTAIWGGLPWIEGRPPTMAQRGLLMGHTRKRVDGRGVTHGRVLGSIAQALNDLGLIQTILEGNRTEGARTYLLRTMGCSWGAVAEITKTSRTNTVIASARKFGQRTEGIPMTAPVLVEHVINRGQRIYEMAAANPDMSWASVADSFSMSETGARNAAETYAMNSEENLVWPLRMVRTDPGRMAYERYIELGTWQQVADDMGYATPSSARDPAHNYYEREGASESLSWPPA